MMIDDLISLYEAGIGSEPLEELLPTEVWEKIPERFRVALTLERLGKVIGTSIAALDDATVRGAAQARWHAAKLAILSSGDSAARAAAATNLTDGDFADPAVMARFREEVEHGDFEVALSFAESFAENAEARRDEVAATLTEYAETLAARGAARELPIVLQAIGAVYTRARVAAPPDLLARLARIAASSLIWEPEPAMICAWSIERGRQFDVLIPWLEADDPDVVAFATWIARKLGDRIEDASRQRLRDALRGVVSRWSGPDSMSNPRLPATIERAKELIAAS